MASASAPARASSPARENVLKVMMSLLSVEMEVRGLLKGRGIELAGADADRMVEAEHEDLAIADLAGFRRGTDRIDDFVHLIGRAGNFQLDLREEAHGIFGAAIDFGVALLPPIALHLGDGQPLNANLSEGVADVVELEGLDDGHDDLHWFDLPVESPISPCTTDREDRLKGDDRAGTPSPTRGNYRGALIKRRASCGKEP